MIKTPLTKILFLDIETVGGCKNYETCKKTNPKVAEQYIKYIDWFQKRFPEDSELSLDSIFVKRAALVPEFAKIVCVFQCLLSNLVDWILSAYNFLVWAYKDIFFCKRSKYYLV